MSFSETGLIWMPPSPNIPEERTTFFYPTTGILGTLSYINIGIGYTTPFQLVTAPWIDAKRFAAHLNKAKVPGVHFHEIWIRSFWGPWKDDVCQGVQLFVTDTKQYSPMKVFYLVLSALKEIYPSKTLAALKKLPHDSMFYKVCGTTKVAEIVQNQEHPYHALLDVHKEERQAFLQKRQACLIPEYSP